MPKIAFVLPVRGGSGGAHSVMQEVTALRDLGVDATVLVNQQNIESFMDTYDRYAWTATGVLPFTGPRELGRVAADADVVVATTNTSVHSIAEAITETKASFRTAYYVQDYEPLFYEAGTVDHGIAVASFAVLPNCTYFAKTHWLCDIVGASHGHKVELVVPSIDHTIYKPARREKRDRRVLCAMVRPDTPRRAPRKTLALMERVAAGEFGPADVKIFGVDHEDLARTGMEIPEGVELIGKLKQTDVATLLRDSDFFVDLSDYQAFGRTAAESMACGCIALAPKLGGASDFIDDGVNAFLADCGDPRSIDTALHRMFSMSDAEAAAMRYAGLEAVQKYTPVRAAISELRALGFA
ncbi:glycosyltransferase family 4 protein [Terrihabitans rhizophilus]|jgi:glycosyltransferase involved in cell wall biosynthesis|uniref:Glycosyltransferase family 4 protein n=1 Tax=Terrihabitans rhizophilus TaxID=3092662 RepID=A0ABU4RLV2_9HYPH|nr:glycosyltransferase family 4 protein [Terrihabitans sp. PJ23]MDX6805799.1 glycosyltransferase family 4 protein [Terrihabitans sp. PJ23]